MVSLVPTYHAAGHSSGCNNQSDLRAAKCPWFRIRASQMVLVVKNQPANAGEIRDWVQSLSREDPLELENPMDRGAWQAKSWELSDLACMCAHRRVTNPRSEVK